MKKRLFRTMAITAVIISLGFTACEQPDNPTHTHQWGAWEETKAATCIAPGVETRTCTLNASHKETQPTAIDQDAHDWGDWDTDIEPTCTETGSGSRVCMLNPSHTETDVEIPALDHDYANWTETAAPTCTEAGEETGTCTRDDGATDTRPISIDPDAHDAGAWHITLDATCTAAGTKELRCTRDNAVLSNDTITIDPDAHAPNTETGLCTLCNALTYNLGDTGPGGGKIFYRLQAGFTQYANAADTVGTKAHYLEAAPVDMSTELAWASSAYQSTDIAGTVDAIGTGRKNTAIILATDTAAPAAKACVDYSNNGKTDWFLPSKDELNELYQNRAAVGNMGTDSYYSSFQHGNYDDIAWYQYFLNGSQSVVSKIGICSVRAVRAF
jgi:hypothetical protein